MTFDQFGLAPDLLRAIADQGYTEPTPVQREAIPIVLAGRDLLAAAQTGTGKTAAFVLPILERLEATRDHRQASGTRPRGGAPRAIRALFLAPTRELALQVEESVRTYGAHRPVTSTVIYGGVGFPAQVRALRAGPEIVVATPGRLLDHVGQGTIDLGRVEILVLDEADRMLDMGFIRDIRRILALLPERRQNLLFSATFSTDIRRLADDLLHDPASVEVSARNKPPELVRQLVIHVDRERKRELLSQLVRTRRIDQALVFTRTKHGANRLALQLDRDGIEAAAIHGNKSQPQRVRALADFKAGRVTVLVATDIAARGLDIESLPHVVNYELPMVPEDYVHRIGRTGRAGVDGEAISLVCVDEARLLRDIEALLRHPIPSSTVEGFEPDRSIRPEPILQRSGARDRMTPARPMARPGDRPAARPGEHGAPWSRPMSRPFTRPIGGPVYRPNGGPAHRPAGGPVHRPAGGSFGAGSRPGSGQVPGRPSAAHRPAGSSIGSGPRPGAGQARSAAHRPDRRHGTPEPWRGAEGGAQPGSHDRRPGDGARPAPGQRSGPPPRPGTPPMAIPGERLARSGRYEPDTRR